MQNQIPLSFQAPENASFNNFIAGENQQLIFSLKNNDESLIFLWGDSGSGKTHLLQALSSQYQQNGLNALYIPLQMSDEFPPELLEGLEMMDLVCLDDIHSIMGHQEWEHALFHFFNKIRENNGRLILAANNSAVNLDIQLADLKSRLSWGLTYQTKNLSDKDIIKVLKLRADQRGFEMTDDTANYLFKRASRDMSILITLLEKLDYESLSEQRKLTIPFIKRFL